jgi:4-hydroxybenzoate polyprenyltransferase
MIKPQNVEKKRSRFLRILSLLSAIRFYNLITIAAAQYAVAVFILSLQEPTAALQDFKLHLIIFSTTLITAAGYIINNFYDSESDHINRPIKANIDGYASQYSQLILTIFLNITAITAAFFISLKAVAFFGFYSFLIWLYSHKIKKYAVAKWICISVVEMMPFAAIATYYNNYSKLIGLYALFLFLIILIRQLLKDLEKIPGDFVKNYQSIAIKYGERSTKNLISVVSLPTIITAFIIINSKAIDSIRYYFYGCAILLGLFLIFINIRHTTKLFKLFHLAIKLMFTIGILNVLIANIYS